MMITETFEKTAVFKDKLLQISQSKPVLFSGLVGSARALVLASLAQTLESFLVLTASSSGAEKLKAEFELLASKSAVVFPALDEEENPSKEIIGQRNEILNAWEEGRKLYIIAPVKALDLAELQTSNLKDQNKGKISKIQISSGTEISLDNIIGQLIEQGYKRFEIVGERGEFSVRGGIVDIFPVNGEFPIRLELAGDKVESIRSFDSFTQRSIGKVSQITILPASRTENFTMPAETLIILDEMLELKRVLPEADLSGIGQIELSAFLGENEAPVFSSPASYIGWIEEIPSKAIIVSRHAARLREELPERNIFEGELGGGFIFDDQEVITDREIFGEPAPGRKGKAAACEGVADELLADLKIGDYVVHENYGIGIFRGMKNLEIEEVKQEYLLIEYAEGDKLFVPPPMIGLVEKYSGGGDARPRLSRLGTKTWIATRNRVKESLRELTQELLQLYAVRQKNQGMAFPPDDIWQKELEATFPFEETVDQQKAIEAVKKDMESGRPMDRLVCGDVGYGKTEVAIRAAAKAASAGKQVAILAPTTILVEQHYNNFKERFKNSPFVVEMLSRFRPAKEQKAAVKLLVAGGVDIVIGTHRLLSKDIRFKDLGLLIIDEEQKFGVKSKEKIKNFKQTVDVLTLTATPIPRTLYFSLAGVRGLSMIATPPVDRSPIRTHILPYSEKVIREAILREVDRGGQVYFVHNFVETIEGVANKIRRLVPEVKVTIGHGQMDAKELEKTMLDFMGRQFDVLVCTSIIESGLDITNVNTILIDQADRFGLSSLYQIRGRVGRSASRAYAYLFYHPARSMSDQAVDRLKAIQEFTALGSGYKLAMRDLEIRGAGNLLGAEQSGHVYEVGFDLYCELLEEAVKEVRGEKFTPPREVDIDLKIEASVPASYVTDDRQRIALYRRMNLVTTGEGIEELRKELEDRFGKVPVQTGKLLEILKLKVRSLELGVRSIKEKEGKIRVEWVSKKVKEFPAGREDKVKLALLNIRQ